MLKQSALLLIGTLLISSSPASAAPQRLPFNGTISCQNYSGINQGKHKAELVVKNGLVHGKYVDQHTDRNNTYGDFRGVLMYERRTFPDAYGPGAAGYFVWVSGVFHSHNVKTEREVVTQLLYSKNPLNIFTDGISETKRVHGQLQHRFLPFFYSSLRCNFQLSRTKSLN